MSTYHLYFNASFDPSANSTWIHWRVNETGICPEGFFDSTLHDKHVEALWNVGHDLSVRCAAQKALQSFFDVSYGPLMQW